VPDGRATSNRVPLRAAVAELRAEAFSAYTMTERFEREVYLKGQMDMADAVLALLDAAVPDE
jgi:hypothetical protein